jgi:Transglycosylase SLT domain
MTRSLNRIGRSSDYSLRSQKKSQLGGAQKNPPAGPGRGVSCSFSPEPCTLTLNLYILNLHFHPHAPRQIFCMMVLFILVAPWSPSAQADIYGYRDKDGFLRFLPTEVAAKTGKQGALEGRKDCSVAVEGIIQQAASRFKVEPCLLKAMIKVESDFDQRAVSNKGALGLMQLMPQTALDMDVKDPFDPIENIVGGTRYLSLLLDRFKHDLQMALAAYNSGPQKVEAYGHIPPFRETQSYVRRVLSAYRLYKGKDLPRHGEGTDVRDRRSQRSEPEGEGRNS